MGEVATDHSNGPALGVGGLVVLRDRPRCLKTADPMPMLRPPDLVDVGEVGVVVQVRALNQFAVRFRRGSFLFVGEDLRLVDTMQTEDADPSCRESQLRLPADPPNSG